MRFHRLLSDLSLSKFFTTFSSFRKKEKAEFNSIFIVLNTVCQSMSCSDFCFHRVGKLPASVSVVAKSEKAKSGKGHQPWRGRPAKRKAGGRESLPCPACRSASPRDRFSFQFAWNGDPEKQPSSHSCHLVVPVKSRLHWTGWSTHRDKDTATGLASSTKVPVRRPPFSPVARKPTTEKGLHLCAPVRPITRY